MRYLILIIIPLLMFMILGCHDSVLTQDPRDEVDAGDFFQTANNLKIATNNLYSMMTKTYFYMNDAKSDNIVPLNPDRRIRGSRKVPTDRGSGGWSWSRLRNINYFLENYHKVNDEAAKAKYSGIARFFRAYFYFNKVKRFGDVPWYSDVLKEDDEELYKARDYRKLVMDSVFADIDYAIDNIPAEKRLNHITKYTALLLKARIGLHEGTFRKYHDLGDYENFLEEGASAAKELIDSGAYTLFTEGGKNGAYRELFARDNQDDTETILAAEYVEGEKTHRVSYRMTAETRGSWGFTKDLINSYLMKDGSRFTERADYKTLEFYEEMQNRDPRLTQTTAGPDFVVNGKNEREPVDLDVATTGYRVIKALPSKDQWGTGY